MDSEQISRRRARAAGSGRWFPRSLLSRFIGPGRATCSQPPLCLRLPLMASSSTAFKTFSLTNDILEVSPQDEIFKYDPEADKRLAREQPWSRECVRVRLRGVLGSDSLQP